MSEAHHHSKQPDQVRSRLLKAATELIVREGYESLTLDRVAKRAGVSKGGLQYHFSSKAVLLRGVCESLKEMFEPMFNEALPEFAREQGEWMHKLIDQDTARAPDLAQMLLLCRFAADRLWIAETSGVLRFDEATWTALLNRLLAFTDSLRTNFWSVLAALGAVWLLLL